MPGASWRNVERRREHRERAQPRARRKLGLLEKHKDYVERAQDFSKKRKRLSALKERAEFRNPDEFYFAMANSRTKDGVHQVNQVRPGQKMSKEMQALLKSQDVQYATHQQVKEQNKVERLKASLHFLSEKSHGQHTLFLDDEEELKEWSAETHFDTLPELAGRTFNRPRMETLRTAEAQGSNDLRTLSKIKKKRDRAYAELEQRLERAKKMNLLRQHLQSHKDRQGKGKRKKVKDAEGDAPAIYKWKKQRKR
eukprot:g2548.t1